MTASNTLMRDAFFFIKNDLLSNITDPISAKRSAKSKFVMTSYPDRPAQYPLVTIKITNIDAARAGMQSTMMDVILNFEIRIWAKNQVEKDTLWNDIYERLRTIQFTATTGTVANNLHNFQVLSSVEVDEDGKGGIKSRILQCQYSFYNLT